MHPTNCTVVWGKNTQLIFLNPKTQAARPRFLLASPLPPHLEVSIFPHCPYNDHNFTSHTVDHIPKTQYFGCHCNFALISAKTWPIVGPHTNLTASVSNLGPLVHLHCLVPPSYGVALKMSFLINSRIPVAQENYAANFAANLCCQLEQLT